MSVRKVKIPAAGYLRMSSDKQDKSIDQQRDEIVTYAARNGFHIVSWYADEGISGWKSKERHSFLQLIADSASGDFKVILCWDQDRFSRFDPMEANFYWHQLRQAGVHIETVTDGKLDFDSLGGWLTSSVKQYGKNEYSKALAKNVCRGRRTRILEGKWCWPAPYGYRNVNGTLQIIPEEAEIVRRIFVMRANGFGKKGIAKQLSVDGVQSPSGSAVWNDRQIGKMLRAKTYIGHTEFGAQADAAFTRMFDRPGINKNTHQPIIDDDLWRDVQAVNERRKTVPAARRCEGAHLSRLLRCGCCGQAMYAQGRKGFYVCGNYHVNGTCSFNTIKFDVALKLVADKVRESLLCNSIEGLTAKIEKSLLSHEASDARDDADNVQKQISELDRKLTLASRRILEVDAKLVPGLERAMLELQERRAVLAARLEVAAAKKRARKSAREIALQMWELDHKMRSDDPAEVNQALSRIIDYVEIAFSPVPMAKNPARKRWVPTGGTVHFAFTNRGTASGCRSPFWTLLKETTVALQKADFSRAG